MQRCVKYNQAGVLIKWELIMIINGTSASVQRQWLCLVPPSIIVSGQNLVGTLRLQKSYKDKTNLEAQQVRFVCVKAKRPYRHVILSHDTKDGGGGSALFGGGCVSCVGGKSRWQRRRRRDSIIMRKRSHSQRVLYLREVTLRVHCNPTRAPRDSAEIRCSPAETDESKHISTQP